MNASEKRILKLAIILFTIGLIVRYLPWGLPSIEEFEVGDAVVIANSPLPTFEKVNPGDADVVDDSLAITNKLESTAEPLIDTSSIDKRLHLTSSEHHRKAKKIVELPLHINTASADDLCALKGVGPKLAEKIIERRKAIGTFKGPSDLKKVHGIGKKKLENMLQSIIFD